MKDLANIFLLIVLLNAPIDAQSFWSFEKLAHISTSSLTGVFSGYADYNELMKWNSSGDKLIRYDELAHNYRTASRIMMFSTGFSIPLSSKLKIWHITSDVALTMVLQGFMHNGFQNIARDKPFFWQSEYQKENNTSGFEKFADWKYQVSALVITTGLNYIIYNVL